MSTKPKFFLLDAGPIIELHRLGLWDTVIERAEIAIPRVIAEHETKFWVREDNSFIPIAALADGDAGKLQLLDCDQAELRETLCHFDRAVQQSVDPGELHALTLLRLWEGEPIPRFCSADRMAVVCLCLLGFSDQAASLERLVAEVGLSQQLSWKYSQQAVDQWVSEGRRRRVQGEGLS